MIPFVLLFALSTFDGVAGVAAINLETGKHFEMNATQQFPMASVYKLPIAIAVLQRIDRDELSLTDEVTLDVDDYHAGHSPIADEANGKPISITIGRLVERMVSESDNSAVDYLLKHIVPPADVRAMFAGLGVKGIDVSRPEAMITGQILNEGDVIETRAMYAARVKAMTKKDEDEGLKKFWNDKRDTSTPAGMADLLAKLYQHKVGLGAESEEILMRYLRGTVTGKDRIRAGIPQDASVAHKTGTMPGTLNDVGIVTTPDEKHHIVIAVFTKWSKKSEEERAKVVAELAKTAYEAVTR